MCMEQAWLASRGARSREPNESVYHLALSGEEEVNDDKPNNMKSWDSKFNDLWIWEILLLFVASFTLSAIVIVLQQYNGKDLPNWPFGITINSILSFIAQVLTACITGVVATCLSQSKWIHVKTRDRSLADINIYDFASRGPIGCLAFLIQHRTGFRNLAALGAALTILSIGVGPLVQQMAIVNNVRIESDVPASAAKAEAFLMSSVNTAGLPFDMVSGIYTSLLNTSGPSTSWGTDTTYCPSGNCDFPQFRSLAVCSHCNDVTKLLSRTNSAVSCGIREAVQFNYTLPTALQITVQGAIRGEENLVGTMSRHTELLGTNHDFGASAFINFTTVEIKDESQSDLVIDFRPKAKATQCSLYFCVNTYSVHVKDNDVHEAVVDSYWDPKAYYDYNLELNPPKEGNLTASPFNIDLESANTLTNWLSDRLSYNYTSSWDCEQTFHEDPRRPEFFQPIQDLGISEVFDRIASEITVQIRKANLAGFKFDIAPEFRKNLPIPGERMRGIVWTSQTQIRVQWAWIAFPISLLLLTLIFFVVTLFQSRNQRLAPWKSSTLPMLCSDLDKNVQRKLMESGDPTKMEDLAKRVKVRLLDGEKAGMRLNVVKSGPY
ncbi:hypothetical protein BDV59DRAFT_148904 [Aspergillus ambiguus]|uniref:DUF3176 domain-containing protein n=1 Tax=Aspergillus ambiguus TaxID=176160 RepID=UPI003CCDEAAC